jgi:hypothetical protein
MPSPQEVSESSVAQFCGMSLAEHAGPKEQIVVRDQATPFWFASVRDTIAFLRLLLLLFPVRAKSPRLRIWTGAALGADAVLQIHHSDPAVADRLIPAALARCTGRRRS